MLLETLDIKTNDVVIYSQNLFSIDKNFKIIYKDDPTKVAKDIGYNEVCSYINEYTPKNLIIYRLLTNAKDFGLRISKYGFFVNINGISELIYFDPIFAIKELEDYAETLNLFDIRFRIQQVGLTTLNRIGDIPNYAEIYSVDLEATEAKFQNDKVFVDAIFAFDEVVKGNVNIEEEIDPPDKKPFLKQQEQFKTKKVETKKEELIRPKKNKTLTKDGFKIIHHDISEDQDFDYKEIMKINVKHGYRTEEKKKNKTNPTSEMASSTNSSELVPKLVKHNHKEQSSFRKYLESSQSNKKDKKDTTQTPTEEKASQLIEIFKSSSPLNKLVDGRGDKQVVLKLNKKRKSEEY
jgi:hypothetical protein